MRSIYLPHLPYKVDVLAYYYLRDLLIVPPKFCVKIKKMSSLTTKKPAMAIDLTTIHGIVRQE